MSSSASSWRRGPTLSACRSHANWKRCRTRCRRFRRQRRKPRSKKPSGFRSRTCSQVSARRWPPPRSRRCIAPKSRRRRAARPVAVKVLRPGIERRFKIDQDAFVYVARKAEEFSAEAQRLRMIETAETLAPLGRARNGSAARGRRLVGNGGEHQGRSGFPRPLRRLAAHRQGRADAGMDRGHASVRSRRIARQGLRPAAARPRGDPDLPASCLARRIFPRRHASGKSVRR